MRIFLIKKSYAIFFFLLFYDKNALEKVTFFVCRFFFSFKFVEKDRQKESILFRLDFLLFLYIFFHFIFYIGLHLFGLNFETFYEMKKLYFFFTGFCNVLWFMLLLSVKFFDLWLIFFLYFFFKSYLCNRLGICSSGVTYIILLKKI